MTINIKILIERRNPHVFGIKAKNLHDSSILLGDNVFTTDNSSQNTSGLEELIIDMFENLDGMGIREVIAYSNISDAKPDSIKNIAIIDPFKFFFPWGWQKADITPSLYKKVEKVLGLITWMKSDHFKRELHSSYKECIICEKTRNESIQGYVKHCTNPDCLSHKLEKMIDPGYCVPKEAVEEQGNDDPFKESFLLDLNNQG